MKFFQNDVHNRNNANDSLSIHWEKISVVQKISAAAYIITNLFYFHIFNKTILIIFILSLLKKKKIKKNNNK